MRKSSIVLQLSEMNNEKGIFFRCLKSRPLMRDGGLHFHVMLCGRGLRATHIHRPITTFLTAKLQLYFIYAAYFRIFFCFVIYDSFLSILLHSQTLQSTVPLRRLCGSEDSMATAMGGRRVRGAASSQDDGRRRSRCLPLTMANR